jgi:hypothetical protein
VRASTFNEYVISPSPIDFYTPEMRHSSIPIGRTIAKNIRKVGACSTCGLLGASIQKLSM